MRQALILLFAIASGLTVSGIVANIYRILAPKPASREEKILYYAVMAIAGPSVLFHNATKSLRGKDCSFSAYAFAAMIAVYWSFALGLAVLALCAGVKAL